MHIQWSNAVVNVNGVESLQMWLAFFGLGCSWLGAQIVWVAPLPRQLRKGDTPSAPKGSQAAFSLFWIDQYGWIGIALCTLGLCSVIASLLGLFPTAGQ